MRLVADANAVAGESFRVRGYRLIAHRDLELFVAVPTWSEIVHELGRRLDSMVTHGRLSVARRGETEAIIVESLARQLTLVPAPAYAAYEAEARDRIPQDPNDWPIVATALMVNAAIWTSDRDFAGTGVATWSTPNLMRGLAEAKAGA